MKNKEQHLEDLKEIRSIMDRSTRFLSLSGLAGILTGIFALAGGLTAYIYLKDYHIISESFRTNYVFISGDAYSSVFRFILLDAGIVLFLSTLAALYFGYRKSKQDNIPFWGNASKRLLINLSIPLAAGGIFCLILHYHGLWPLIAPSTLIFYGMALLNAGKYTLKEIRYLGILEIGIGLASAYFVHYGLLFWIIGFGILHIIYGAIMYFKYER